MNKPTHGRSIIDVILTDAECYTTSTVQAPLGITKHKCVFACPSPPPPPTYNVRTTRPFRDSSVREFGQWCTAETWNNILTMVDANQAAESFTTLLRTQYERCFPERRVRVRSNNKPWITPTILRLMKRRRSAWNRGRRDIWRLLYRQIKREIRLAKRETA